MPYNIKVKCVCGKVLKIPEQYAGKRGRCPNCGKMLPIPSLEEIQKKAVAPKEVEAPGVESGAGAEPEVRHCPTCGAFLNPGDTVCVSCHTNLATGEWDMEGKTAQLSHPGLGKGLILSGIAALLLIAVIVTAFARQDSLFAKKSSLSLSPLPAETGTPNLLSSEVKKLLELPDHTTETMEKKLHEFELVLEKSFQLAVMKEYNALLLKKRELQAIKSYQTLMAQENMTPIVRWSKLKELAAEYRDLAPSKWNQELQDAEKQCVALAQNRTKEAQEQLATQKYSQVLLHNLRWFTEVMRDADLPDALYQELKSQANLSREALDKSVEPTVQNTPSPTAKNQEEEALQLFKSRFNDALSSYRQYIEIWEFSKAVAHIAPLADEAVVVLKKYPEESDIAKVILLRQEAKLLEKFVSTVNQAIKGMEGSKQTIFLRKRKALVGNINKFEEGKIYIQDSRTNQIEAVSLFEISPSWLGRTILANNKDNSELYLATTIFYYINAEPTECRDAAQKSLKLGVLPKEVEKYQKWAEGALAEKEAMIKDTDLKLARDKQQSASALEQSKIEKIRKDARRIIQKLLQEYKEGNNERVLGYLEDLREFVPRDELIKLSGQIKKEEGQSLVKIAETVFKHCNFCQSSGTVKCAPCRGSGIIEKDSLVIGSAPLPSKKSLCTRCKGKGELDCELCYDKRHNRKFILLFAYYDNF